MPESQTIRRIIGEGREEGRLEQTKESIQTILQARFGEEPQNLQTALSGTNDIDTLKRWLRSAATAASLDEFRAAMK
jgi:hypothetical protein